MKSFIKYLTLLGNLCIATLMLYLAVDEGFYDGGEVLLFVALLLLILLNSYFVFSASKGGDWLTLFLKRKALEEGRKIENLSKGN